MRQTDLRVEWDEDRRQLTDKEAGKMNLSFSTDDEFYKATRDALPWTDPDSDGLGADPGRMLIPTHPSADARYRRQSVSWERVGATAPMETARRPWQTR